MLYGNIQAGRENNFIKQAYGEGLVYEDAPYDPSSVMHYGRTVRLCHFKLYITEPGYASCLCNAAYFLYLLKTISRLANFET